MSDGAHPPPVLLLPADLGLRDATVAAPLWRRTDWPAIVAALLLHLVVIAALLIDWRLPPAAPPPASVPVTIVFAPPAPAPAAPQPAPRPSFERKSGNDTKTTAPPSAETTDKASTRAPESAAMAEPKPPEPQAAPAPPSEKPPPPQHDAKSKSHDAPALDPRKQADRARAPQPAPEHLHIEPGDREQAGDPYLNRARDLLERHRTYPTVVGRYGVPVEGTSTYDILLDRKGGLRGIKLVDSSGAAALDDAAAAMIRETAPFPPLPANYPGEAVIVTITIHLFPKPAW